MNFRDALKHTLKHEGGFVNHPQDPGGMTNLGVTKKALEAYLRHPVSEEDMRSLTPDDVEDFYRSGYWMKAKCDKMPSGVDYAVFDTAVNSGPKKAAILLQNTLGVVPDGIIGPKTMKAVEGADQVDLVLDYIWEREKFLRSLSTFPVFGKGWLARLRGVRNVSLKAIIC